MNNFQELEVKILNINVADVKEKLKNIGADYKKETIQKIYTYDCYSPLDMYKLAISDYLKNRTHNSLMKIAKIYSQLEPVIKNEEKKIIKNITGFESISDYIINCVHIEETILTNVYIMNLIKEVENRFFKWIRLRQNAEKVELTIKYIYSRNENYKIDDVKEIEICVDNFEIANIIIEEMGYYRKKVIEKKRTSYEYNSIKIEIDEWPLIKPYIEIEGEEKEEIYELVRKMGYSNDDAQIINTDDVYLHEGIDLNSYEVLTFDSQKVIK